MTEEEKAIYDESGTKGLKAYTDSLKINNLLEGINAGASENTDSGLSNQDILDLINGGADAGGNITDTTGLDTGETIPGGTDGTETITVTGDKGVVGGDASTNTTNTTNTTNLGTVNVTACGPGKVRNAKGDCVPIDCGEGKYWDPVTNQCELKKVETVDVTDTTGSTTNLGNVTVTACGPGKVRNAAGDCGDIDCGEGKYWDPTTGQCELKKVETVDVKGDGTDTVTVTACGPGKVRNAKGDCVDIDCGAGKYWDPITQQCELKKADDTTTTTLTCGEDEELSADGKSCIPKIVIKACPIGQVRNAAGVCVPIDCGAGKYWDPVTEQCEVKKVDTLTCGANEELSPDGKSCLTKCGTGYKRGPDGISCVPVTGTTITTPVVVTPKTTTDATLASAATPATSTETTNPIYAGAMDDFDLFSTLSDLLTAKEDKKTPQQTQQTTKMASGGHLDDLLAEQMTVDDLLKLLR